MTDVGDQDDCGGDDDLATDSLSESHERHFPLLSSMTLRQVEQQVSALPNGLTLDHLLQWLDLTSVLMSRAKHIRMAVEQIAVQWINANGPICVGDIRYAVAHPSTVKCMNVPLCLDHVMEACGGDMLAFCSYLRSDPFKYGSVRQLLGQAVFDQVFRVEVRPKLVEGKPQKQLVRSDQRFVR